MSLAPVSMDRQPSPRLTVNLGSNNPFRNRTASSTLAPPTARPPRPLSTNPFLADSELLSLQSAGSSEMSSPVKTQLDPEVTGRAAELFENLSLEQRKPNGRRPAPPRPENIPPRDPKPVPPRPRRNPSGDESSYRRNPKPEQPLIDVFADPGEGPSKLHSSSRRPRRNSDSSLMERPSKTLDPEEERRRRERRHREREARHREGKSSRSKSNYNSKLDVIDKLDVTGIYGSGFFHHDGPFDACNPHRNRKGLRTAPLQAFPKDSGNMALGGSGPINSNIDLNQFHGRGAEGYTDFAATGIYSSYKSGQGVSFDPSTKLEPIHGQESLGLGTSTFLEGTPASRAAIERRQSENEAQALQNGGLQRKKSLAQKIRGINNRSGSGGGGNRVTSPEPIVGRESNSLGTSTTRPTSSKRPVSRNPFFQDYDDAYEQKGVKIKEAAGNADGDDVSRPRSVSSPKSIPSLERRVTADGVGDFTSSEETANKPSGSGIGGGLISRVKSLRRPRPERRPTVPSKNEG